jgi:hypothetical protein
MASVMNSSNKLRGALFKGNGLSFGAWQMLPGTHLSRSIARSGFDWICIDTEVRLSHTNDEIRADAGPSAWQYSWYVTQEREQGSADDARQTMRCTSLFTLLRQLAFHLSSAYQRTKAGW